MPTTYVFKEKYLPDTSSYLKLCRTDLIHISTHRFYFLKKKKQQNITTHLFCKLFLTEFVKGEELLGQHNVLHETTASQLHTYDDGSVWYHHSHSTEVDLQILRQLLTSSITRILLGRKYGLIIETYNYTINVSFNPVSHANQNNYLCKLYRSK